MLRLVDLKIAVRLRLIGDLEAICEPTQWHCLEYGLCICLKLLFLLLDFIRV